MFEITSNKEILITKGDSASIKMNMVDADGQAYTMHTTDDLTITVRKKPGSSVIMTKTSHTNVIDLTPEDTSSLQVGKCCYDIQLKTGDDVYTLAGLTDKTYTNMVVYPEITEEVE